MKKKIALILCMGMVLLNGCHPASGDPKNAEIGGAIGDYIILEKQSIDDNLSGAAYKYICYDKRTKIEYVILASRTYYEYYVYSISPYYVMNENNKPIIGVYNEDIKWEIDI